MLILAASIPAPIAAPQLALFLLQGGVLLSLAIALGAIATRLGLPAVVGELLAGVVLGPSLLGQVAPGLAAALFPPRADQFHLLDSLGQVAVLLLVGVTAISLDIDLVRRRGATAVRVSVAGLFVPLALGVVCGFLLPAALIGGPGGRLVFAFLLGIAMCVSAIPVIAKTLIDMDLLHRDVGQLILAAGVVDGTIGWLLLSVVSAMTVTGIRTEQVAASVAVLLVIVAAAATAGRPVVGAILRAAQKSTRDGFTTGVVVAMLLLAGAATQAVGFEAILGTFVCGVLIATSGELGVGRVASLRAVVVSTLAPLFFATAGLRIDLTALRDPQVALAGLVVLVVAVFGKFIGAAAGAALSRMNRWEALALGAGMNARGIVEIVVATVGLRLGVLNTASYTLVVLVAIATSVMAPPALRWAVSNITETDDERRRQTAATPGLHS